MEQPLDLSVSKYRLNGPLKKRPNVVQFPGNEIQQTGRSGTNPIRRSASSSSLSSWNYSSQFGGNPGPRGEGDEKWVGSCYSEPSTPGNSSTDVDASDNNNNNMDYSFSQVNLSRISSSSSIASLDSYGGMTGSGGSTGVSQAITNNYGPTPDITDNSSWMIPPDHGDSNTIHNQNARKRIAFTGGEDNPSYLKYPGVNNSSSTKTSELEKQGAPSHGIRRPWEDDDGDETRVANGYKKGFPRASSPKKTCSKTISGYHFQLTPSSSSDSLVEPDSACSSVSSLAPTNESQQFMTQFSRPMFSFSFGSRLAASNLLSLDSLDLQDQRSTVTKKSGSQTGAKSGLSSSRLYQVLNISPNPKPAASLGNFSPNGQATFSNFHSNENQVMSEKRGDKSDGKKSSGNHGQYPRKRLNQRGVSMLSKWYDDNVQDPYPTPEVVHQLAIDGGLTETQIRKWLANKRLRSKNTSGYSKYHNKGKSSKKVASNHGNVNDEDCGNKFNSV